MYDPEDKKYSWVSSWQEKDGLFEEEAEDNLPLIVKVEVGIPKGKIDQKFVKRIQIPSACCWPLLEE